MREEADMDSHERGVSPTPDLGAPQLLVSVEFSEEELGAVDWALTHVVEPPGWDEDAWRAMVREVHDRIAREYAHAKATAEHLGADHDE